MQSILTWLAAHPEMVAMVGSYILANIVFPAIPREWAAKPGISLVLDILGRLVVVSHSQSPGTLSWPGMRDAAIGATRDAMLAARAPSTSPPSGPNPGGV